MISAESPHTSSTCPPWCNREHENTSDLGITHNSDGLVIPGIQRVVTPKGDVEPPSVVELTVGLEQTHDETWVWLVPDGALHRSTVLSVESAKRLHREISELLNHLP